MLVGAPLVALATKAFVTSADGGSPTSNLTLSRFGEFAYSALTLLNSSCPLMVVNTYRRTRPARAGVN